MKKKTLLFIFILFAHLSFAQDQPNSMVKTNIVNLVAKRPTIAIEKTFSNRYGLELAYTSGEIKNLGYRDYLHYEGFLLRAKK